MEIYVLVAHIAFFIYTAKFQWVYLILLPCTIEIFTIN